MLWNSSGCYLHGVIAGSEHTANGLFCLNTLFKCFCLPSLTLSGWQRRLFMPQWRCRFDSVVFSNWAKIFSKGKSKSSGTLWDTSFFFSFWSKFTQGFKYLPPPWLSICLRTSGLLHHVHRAPKDTWQKQKCLRERGLRRKEKNKEPRQLARILVIVSSQTHSKDLSAATSQIENLYLEQSRKQMLLLICLELPLTKDICLWRLVEGSF